ncbi:hypothetical protein K1719_028806 [Acacia pycnantha]|nr:hypothetical protein K1719_028806 [Acacia pycnantha]
MSSSSQWLPEAGDSRFEGHERVQYTRNQLLQLIENAIGDDKVHGKDVVLLVPRYYVQRQKTTPQLLRHYRRGAKAKRETLKCHSTSIGVPWHLGEIKNAQFHLLLINDLGNPIFFILGHLFRPRNREND